MIEVVIALGLFATAIVSVLAVFGSLAHSVRANRDADAAAAVADTLSIRLRTLPFDRVASLIKAVAPVDGDAGGTPDNGVEDRDLFYANKSGDRIGLGDDPVWNGGDRDKFFEMTLVRNEELSPVAQDGEAAWIAFNVRVRWPAFRPLAGGGTARARESGREQVLLLSGSVRR